MTYDVYDHLKERAEGKKSERTEFVKEAVPAYMTKKPGEYTLEDYYALPDDIRAELIDGEIIVMEAPSAVHQIILFKLSVQFENLIQSNNGECIVLPAPLDVQLDCDDKTMLQPDISVICKKDRIKKKNIWGAPDLVVEISSPSTRRYDATRKGDKYCNAGVREYWIVDLEKQKVVIYDFEGNDLPTIHTFEEPIPIRIYQGEYTLNLSPIKKLLTELNLDQD